MVIDQFTYYVERLQQKNYKSFYLAFLRVAVGVWLLKEVVINWPYMDILYGGSTFVVPKITIISRIPGALSFIHDNYIWIICTYMLVILLFIFGIGRWVTALILFLMVHFIQKICPSFINGGDKMVRLILLYMIFANSYQYFVLSNKNRVSGRNNKVTNLLSNLAALSIMLQLCLAYFAGGISKLSDPVWLNGEATYYALSMERFSGTSLNEHLVKMKWFDYISNYGTILFELLFPVLIWIKKFRKPLLITGVIFHLGIYIFMMIYGFQVVFLLVYGLFLPEKKLLHFYQSITNGSRKNKTSVA